MRSELVFDAGEDPSHDLLATTAHPVVQNSAGVSFAEELNQLSVWAEMLSGRCFDLLQCLVFFELRRSVFRILGSRFC